MTTAATVLSPAEAVRLVRSGDRVYIGSNCAQPTTLVNAFVAQADRLRAVEIVHLLTFGPAPYCEPGLEESFRHAAFFIAANTRQAVKDCRADFIPVFLSEIPGLFKDGQCPVDVAMVAVSAPDDHGFCSLGISVDIGLSACRHARAVIAEIQPDMPRTLGDSCLHVNEITAFCHAEHPLIEHKGEPPDDSSRAIARHVAGLVRDGACLQTGFGKLPSAVLEALADKNDLGVHTEMFSDPLVRLVQAGNVNCRRKSLHPNKVVTTFVIGTGDLFREVDDNPFYEFRPTEQVNDPWVISQLDDMVAINSAIEVDLTGQVVADSIGNRFYSGIGGQVDFIRGAARSKGGRPIIALPSTALGGKASRIVASLQPNAGVVTSRGDVHYVATEHGVAYLHGRPVRERVLELIRIAHPDFRDQLLEEAKDLGYVPRHQPSVRHVIPPGWATTHTTPDGQVLNVRPIRPSDEDALKHHFHSLSEEARRQRFHGSLPALTNATFQELVNVDHRTHVAFVASEQGNIAGVARFYVDPAHNSAEMALAVLDDFQGKGIGRALTEALVRAARDLKLWTLEAWVLRSNQKLPRLLRSLGLPLVEEDGQDVAHMVLDLREKRTSVVGEADQAANLAN